MRARLFVRAALAALLLVSCASARSQDLLDYVIQAVDPTLAPARPLIECLAGGGGAEYCAVEAAKKQVAGALPIGPGDNSIKLVVAVFGAAREERWLDVLTVGGQVIAEKVSCAMLPVQGPLKAPACSVVGWVIAENAKVLDQAWHALTGPDWWALVDLLGTAACKFIPAEGAASYAKDALCGPLAAALAEAKQWADTMAKGVVAGADALENLVFGSDSHMPYDRYFALYWQPWYHYSTARIWKGENLGPAVAGVYSQCVDYFDSHNQYRSTAKKTCSDLKARFDKEVKGFAAALPVAVNGYFETIARPAIRGFARSAYGKPAAENLPGEELFVSNCSFQMRIRFPFPGPDDTACALLLEKGKQYGNVGLVPLGPLYAQQAKACYSNVEQQTLDPTVWQMACDDLRYRYGQAFAGESLKLVKIIGELKKKGCTPADPDKASKLLFQCQTFAAHAACLEAMGPNGDAWCAKPILRLSSADQGPGTVAAAPPAAVLPPAGRATPDPLPGTASRASANPAATGRSTVPAADRPRITPTTIEAETLAGSDRVRLRGGRINAQGMRGFGAGWSGDAQLFWSGGEPGATLDLLVDVPADGAWQVEIALTQAPDYGSLAFEVDQHPVEVRFDGYAARVAGPVVVPLGTFAMLAGRRPVSIMIAGRNAQSTGWFAGIDRIVLRPASGR